jgi:anti-sigma-K factor RskA
MTKQGKEKERLKSSLSLRLWVIQKQEENVSLALIERRSSVLFQV